MALAQFFYPSLIWPGGRIDFDEAYRISIPDESPVGSNNIAASGLQETVIDRVETTITIVFWPITTSRLTEIRNYFHGWAKYGRPSQLILDRLNTCVGQYEYDTFNTFFTKAILVTNPLRASRGQGVESRARYQIAMQWRQDGG